MYEDSESGEDFVCVRIDSESGEDLVCMRTQNQTRT